MASLHTSCSPGQLENDPTRVVLDVGPPDVGHDVEAFHDLVDEGSVDERLRERDEQAEGVVVRHRDAPTDADAQTSAGGSTKPVKNGPNSP